MPLKTNDFINIPFADKGDKRPIPDQALANQEMSMEEGFTLKYAENPEVNGFYIEREKINQLFFDIMQKTQTLQLQGGRLFDRAILNSSGYPLGARCLVYINTITQKLQEDTAGANPYELSTIQIVSMKDNNKTDPFVNNGIGFFNDWWIDDGLQVGMAKIVTIPEVGQIGAKPWGYIEVGNNTPNQTYQFSTYKRVEALFIRAGRPQQIGQFINDGGNAFRLSDFRGLGMRVWSNGGNIDAGRNFNDIQMSGAPNIVGIAHDVVCSNLSGTGAFTKQQIAGQALRFGPDRLIANLDFNAARSSGIFGAANELRMANFNIRLFVKV